MKPVLDRARAYLEKMPPAIESQGGDWATYCAAAVLMRGFALPEAEALPLLRAWNQTHCQPAWTEAELRGKIRSAQASSRPLGYLLEGAKTFAASSSWVHLANQARASACRRGAWPRFQPLAVSAIERVAALRQLPVAAVRQAHDLGYLRGAVVGGHRCYVLHEGSFAQARRLDGEPFVQAGGARLKAKNLPGSEGAFIGVQTLGGPGHRVLLVEGVIALLEALAAHELSAPAESWCILAATSASSRFARAPELLGLLAGRRVRIVPDDDLSGRQAAAIWLRELRTAGARVDAFRLPPGCKDLGPLVSPAASSQYTSYLTELFQ